MRKMARFLSTCIFILIACQLVSIVSVRPLRCSRSARPPPFERMYICFIILYLFSPCRVSQVDSSGVFELKVHSFTSPGGVCKNSQDCRIFFRVCLKHSQDVISAEPPCTYGIGLTDIFSAEPSSIASSAPIKVPFNFKWPVSFLLYSPS